MDIRKKRQVGKSIGALLRWLMLSLLLVSTHALAQTGGTVTYVYTDPQGTPLAEADASGNITATFEYTPYGSYAPQGTSTPGAAPKGPGYTGHVNDPETNLVYMQARYYDPVTGHFLSTDPVRPSAGDAFNFNRYAYVNNNPIMGWDPTGMEDACPVACMIMRQISDGYSRIASGAWGDANGSPSGMMTQQAQATASAMNGSINAGLADAAASAAPVADAIPGVSLVGCADQGCSKGEWIFAGLAVMPEDAEFLNLGRIGATGKIGENALKVLGGAPESFRTPFGMRFVDRFAGGIINESKVGYVSLTSFVRRQIQKDAWLIQNTGRIDGAAWHFFQSPVTGRGGPSGPLREALGNAGIRVIEH